MKGFPYLSWILVSKARPASAKKGRYICTFAVTIESAKIPSVSDGWVEEYFLQASWSAQIFWWSVSSSFPALVEDLESGVGLPGGGKWMTRIIQNWMIVYVIQNWRLESSKIG